MRDYLICVTYIIYHKLKILSTYFVGKKKTRLKKVESAKY